MPVARRLRIGIVAPVATSVPPAASGSIETITALLADGLVDRGHDVTLFAAGHSRTRARLHATFDLGYREDDALWPWEYCELLNLAAAVERADAFDVLHVHAEYQPLSLAFARLVQTPLLHTVHHLPTPGEVVTWRRYADAPFVAVSHAQAAAMHGLTVAATVLHGIDTAALPYRGTSDDYVLFLGRFTEGKGVRTAIDVATRTGLRVVLAAEMTDYYREQIAPLVDGHRVVYAGEVAGPAKAALLGGARALLYPIETAESFGLVLAEAMACGTPVAAFGVGAACEIVTDGLTGGLFDTTDAMVSGLPRVLALDRAAVRAEAIRRFDAARMVDDYVRVYLRQTQRTGARASESGS